MKLEKQFLEVVRLIKKARANSYKAANIELINVYWQVGEYVSKRIARSVWGDKTVTQLDEFIQKHHPDIKGFTKRGLYRMKQFYDTYHRCAFIETDLREIQPPENQFIKIASPPVTQFANTGDSVPAFQVQTAITDIRNSLLTKTSWTNHLIILTAGKTEEEREFYIRLCIRENYGKRELERQIKSGIYERVMMGKQKVPSLLRQLKPEIPDVIKDNYVFEFLSLPKNFSERELQTALISQMKDFILELGKDYLFMGEKFRLQVGTSDFELDLLFYHRGLLCMILFELKIEKFKPEFLGKLNFYLEAIDRDVRKAHEKPSIGILLCPQQDSAVVEYALSRSLSPALVAQYQLQLPDKKILKEKFREIFVNNK